DLAEKPVPQPPAQEELPAPGAKLRSDELGAPARAAVQEHEYRLQAQFDEACEDLRRTMLLEVRDELVERAQAQAAERLACEPYRSSLRSHEAEMVDGVLEEICLSPGDRVYLVDHDVLYVTLT